MGPFKKMKGDLKTITNGLLVEKDIYFIILVATNVISLTTIMFAHENVLKSFGLSADETRFLLLAIYGITFIALYLLAKMIKDKNILSFSRLCMLTTLTLIAVSAIRMLMISA